MSGQQKPRPLAQRLLWFAALWLGGVGTVTLLSYGLRLRRNEAVRRRSPMAQAAAARAMARQATLPSRKYAAVLAPDQNIENNPMQSNEG